MKFQYVMIIVLAMMLSGGLISVPGLPFLIKLMAWAITPLTIGIVFCRIRLDRQLQHAETRR